MISEYAKAYRSALRELRKSTIAPRRVSSVVTANFRSIVEKSRKAQDKQGLQAMEDAALFIRSQREHKLLLDRYNPLHDLTAGERITATARRVGLSMPTEHKG